MKIDKNKLRDIVLESIKGKGKGIRHCAYIPSAWGYEVRQSKGRRTINGNLTLPGADANKVWINTLAQYSNQKFSHWYWLGIPRDIAEKILVFGVIPRLNETDFP